jgi:integrase/recombinase XerD
MVTVQTPQITDQNKIPLNSDQVLTHTEPSRWIDETSPEAPKAGDAHWQRLYIDRSIERLIQGDLFGQIHVERFLHRLSRRGCRLSTLKINFSAIYLFIAYLKSRQRSLLETTVRADIGAFIEHEQDRGLAATTISTRLRCLYAFLRYLAGNDVVNPDILKKKYRIKLPDTLPRAIDPQDIARLLAVINHIRNRAMVLMLLRTGMRIGELLELKIEDVNVKEKRVEILQARKTRHGRVVYLSEDACSALNMWLKIRDRQKVQLFYAQGRKDMGYEASRMLFKKYLDKAGLSHKGYCLHCLRHTFASELLNAGMRLECVQQLLGHRNIEMTRRYARLTDVTRKEEYFRAMAIIEKGQINGHYRIDR